jgi:ATP-binding cassette subfamily F protein 3
MERLAPVLASADFTFEFKEPANLPNPMLAMEDAYFGYPPPEDAPDGTPPTVIVRNVSKSVMAGQRIGILGANGQGKSTLVKTIARALAPISGIVQEGKGLNVGYFAQQELDVLRPLDNPLEHMVRMAKAGLPAGQSGREQDLRTFLGTFNFSGDMVKQPVGTMSGGEKARLVLCMIVWQRPNLLLLDEPTNHLDLATREALAMALNEFEGTVMLVSHDRSLLRSVCDEFWLVSRGGIEPFDGDLDDYQRYLLDEAKRGREELKASLKEAKETVTQAPPPVVENKKISARLKTLKRDQGKLEQRMLELQTRKHALEARLSKPLPTQEIGELGSELKAVDEELANHEEKWLAISEEIEVETPAS